MSPVGRPVISTGVADMPPIGESVPSCPTRSWPQHETRPLLRRMQAKSLPATICWIASSVHVPPTHDWRAPHGALHPPQLSWERFVSTQTELHRRIGVE